MSLFVTQSLVLHSGDPARWKIECDALTDDDIATLALMLSEVVPPFGSVYGIPRGGWRLATAIRPYATVGPLLIVDDVLTTGASMEEVASKQQAACIGAVLFARGRCPGWVTPLFQMPLFRRTVEGS